MKQSILAFVLYIFYIFCAGWMEDWITSRSGVPQEELEEFAAQQEKLGKEGKRKIEWFFSAPQPDARALRRWSLEHAADPAMYRRCLWISRICDLPVAAFGIRVLLAVTQFAGVGPVSATWFWGFFGYSVFLLLLGIRYRRNS